MILPQLLYNGLVTFAVNAPLICVLHVRFQIYHFIDFGSGIVILSAGYFLTERSLFSLHISEVAAFAAAISLTLLLDIAYRALFKRPTPPSHTMIAGLTALMVAENSFDLGFGSRSRALTYSLSPISFGSIVMQRQHLLIALWSTGCCLLLTLPPVRRALLTLKASADDPALARRWNVIRPFLHVPVLLFCASAFWVFSRNIALTRYFDPRVGLGSIMQVIAAVLISVNQSLVYLIGIALCLTIGSELIAAFAGEAYRHLISISVLCAYTLCSKQHADIRLR